MDERGTQALEKQREQVIENIVRRYLERDEISDAISDWLTNVYMDDTAFDVLPDLFNRIAVERPLPEVSHG